VLVACGASLFAIVFRESITWVFNHVYPADDVLDAFRTLPLAARVVIPAVGGLGAGALSALAARKRVGAGVGDVMEAVVLGQPEIPLGSTTLKAFGSWCAIVAGGSIGREGPLIQFGGALASFVGKRFGITERRRRALIAAGTAAGFAAAYNTPFAAVLFVTGVVTGVEALGVVLPTILAAAIATSLTRLAVGPGPLYGYHPFALDSQWELVVHLLLGVLAGFVGVAFMRVLRSSEQGFRALPLNRPLRAALGGAIVGVMACAVPEVTGNGYEVIVEVLASPMSVGFLALLLVSKTMATSASVGSGSPGGVFTPSLVLGATLGAIVAGVAGWVAPSAGLGAAGGYALVGMAAVVAATTHAPLMAAVLVFELSGDYAIALPLLVATSAATAVARWCEPTSIYMQELSPRGLAWEITLEGRRLRAEE